MFLPIGDEPNPSTPARATLALIVINTAIWLWFGGPLGEQSVSLDDPVLQQYLAVMRQAGVDPWELVGQTSAYDLLTFQYGFRPAHPSVVALFASLFLHAGWLHLGGNMLFLWIFGDNVESRLGPKRFLAVYVATGVLATLFYALMRPTSSLPLIGASGAISGILGCYFVWFPYNRVRVLMTLLIFFHTFYVPARTVLLFYLIVENLLPFLVETSHGGGVAHGAHVGGFFAGTVFALFEGERHGMIPEGWLGSLWRITPLATWAKNSGTKQQSSSSSKPSYRTQSVADLMAANRLNEAVAAYDALDAPAAVAVPFLTVFALSDHLTHRRELVRALALLQRSIAGHPYGPSELLAVAHMRAGLLLWRGLCRPQQARQHFFIALQWQKSGEVADAARRALNDIQSA